VGHLRNTRREPSASRRCRLSLHPQTFCAVPEETVRVARAAYPKGNVYLQVRDELGTISTSVLGFTYSYTRSFVSHKNRQFQGRRSNREGIGQIHDAAQDRLACGMHAQTCCQPRSSFATGRQSNRGELLTVTDRQFCSGVNQLGKALRKDFAHAKSKLDTATTTGGISHRSVISAMNGGR
jgi:hypothetical protein